MKIKKLQKKQQKTNHLFFNKALLFLYILLLPTQLGKHFFFDFSYLSGVRVDYLAPTIYVTDILASLLFILNLKTIWHFLRQKKILILLLLLFLNILVSKSPNVSMYRYIKILELIGVVAIFKKNLLSGGAFLLSFFVGAVFELILSTAQLISKHSLQGIFYFFGERSLSLSTPGIAKASLNGVEILRSYGTFSHPNSLAGFYLVLYFYVLANKKFKPHPFLKNLFFVVSALLIFFSFSKIAISVFLILNLIYFWRNFLKSACRICFVSRIIVIGVLALIFLNAQTDPLTLKKRWILTQNALTIIRQNPLFGVGNGNYLIAQNQFREVFTGFLNQPVHNVFLLLIAEIGVLLVLFITILLRKQLKRFFKHWPYVIGSLLLTGLFDHYWLTLQQNFLLLAVILGVL